MSLYLRALALICCLVLGNLTTARAADTLSSDEATTFSTEIGFDLATGRYGNTVSTTTLSIPVSVLYLPTPRLDLGLMIPYLWQNNDLVVEGRPVQNPSVQAGPGGILRRPAQHSQAVHGFGDLVGTVGYLLFKEGDYAPQLRGLAAVKFPTAESGLGTGAFDEIVGLAATKSFGAWYLYASGNYTFQGKTSLFTARDFADGETGVGYEVIPGLRPSLGVRGATAVETGTGGTMLLGGKLVWALSDSIDLKAYLDRGLATAAPDWQGGASLAFNF
ncbi:hypothetical protein GMLC_44050 [Geomonas limicola]|uniref:Transporter n=1 Tax=Geomonas limicola TaxID=2740186 RepID=A0A6V8NE47_9BACT|nr:transporter [Geomonas limicola]GFO70826.1 hypothetical protein GMLC_44050 [Geomonas limicola]